MTPADLHNIDTMASAEGWNSGLSDSAAFYAADPNGFLIGEVDNKTACIISVVKYGTDYGFLGLYICAPEFRGQGHGWAIWQAGMKYLKGRTIGLDGVVEQQDNYSKSGFNFAHRSIRFCGEMILGAPTDTRLVDVTQDLIPALIAYDRAFIPAERTRFIQNWVAPNTIDRQSIALKDSNGICGYGTIRKCAHGYKIGPLFAETSQDADTLLQALCARIGPNTVYLDIPEPHTEGIKFAERYGMTYDFECARMYLGDAPDLPHHKIWGNTTFELG